MLSKRKIKNKIRVTFTLSALEGEESVHLVGEFNHWNREATPMTRNAEGEWEVKLDLEPDSEYQYRYLVNGLAWRNDPSANGCVRNPFGSDNSLVSTAAVRRTPRTTSKERTAKPRSNRKTEGV